MEVFHYLSLVLKNTPHFEGTSEVCTTSSTAASAGTIYNNFDRPSCSFWSSPRRVSTENTAVLATEDVPVVEMVPQQLLDDLLLQHDVRDPSRWAYNVPLFDSHSDPKSFKYMQKVFKIVTVGCHVISLYGEDRQRFTIRHRNEWSGSDTMYDAWLLIAGLQRAGFDYDAFQEIFPKWRDLHKHYNEQPEDVARSTFTEERSYCDASTPHIVHEVRSHVDEEKDEDPQPVAPSKNREESGGCDATANYVNPPTVVQPVQSVATRQVGHRVHSTVEEDDKSDIHFTRHVMNQEHMSVVINLVSDEEEEECKPPILKRFKCADIGPIVVLSSDEEMQ